MNSTNFGTHSRAAVLKFFSLYQLNTDYLKPTFRPECAGLHQGKNKSLHVLSTEQANGENFWLKRRSIIGLTPVEKRYNRDTGLEITWLLAPENLQ